MGIERSRSTGSSTTGHHVAVADGIGGTGGIGAASTAVRSADGGTDERYGTRRTVREPTGATGTTTDDRTLEDPGEE